VKIAVLADVNLIADHGDPGQFVPHRAERKSGLHHDLLRRVEAPRSGVPSVHGHHGRISI
jgi:hypothetical protein